MPMPSLYYQIKTGMVRVTSKSPIEWRFWKRVEKDGPVHPVLKTPCWLWTGGRMKSGYGNCGTIGLAHRFSYLLHFGPIPADLLVLHQCDNPPCVNPDHLLVGTSQDNTDDMMAKGRYLQVGENQHAAVLTETQVREIRERYQRYSHKNGCGALAKEYGVCLTQIWRIVHNKKWRHVV